MNARSISALTFLLVSATPQLGFSQTIRETLLVPVYAGEEEAAPSILSGAAISSRLEELSSSAADIFSGNTDIPITTATPPSVPINSLTCPTNLAGLTDGWDMFTSKIDRKVAASLGLYASAELSANSSVILYQWMWYKDLLDDQGNQTGRCGSGISLALEIKNLEANASLSLPFLAAASQLGQKEIQYRLKTFGLSGAVVNQAIPLASRVGEFNTQSYAELLGTIDKIQEAGTAGASATFTPRLVSVAFDVPISSPKRIAMVQVHALRQITARRTCSQAKSNAAARDEESDSLVEEIYMLEVNANACASNIQPDSQTSNRIKADLQAFGISAGN